MLHAWQELKIFSPEVLEAIRAAIRSGGDAHASLLDEAAGGEDEDEDLAGVEARGINTAAPEQATVHKEDGQATAPPSPKKRRVEEAAPKQDPRDQAKASMAVNAVPNPKSEKIQSMVDRLLSVPADKPFVMLGIAAETASGHDIRKAYRRIALLIHPDKNPGMEASCQEALIRLQQGREQAESDLQRNDLGGDSARGETRSAATAAAANATVDSGFTCKYPGCSLPPCKQCANGCCTRNITHCHMIARTK